MYSEQYPLLSKVMRSVMYFSVASPDRNNCLDVGLSGLRSSSSTLSMYSSLKLSRIVEKELLSGLDKKSRVAKGCIVISDVDDADADADDDDDEFDEDDVGV